MLSAPHVRSLVRKILPNLDVQSNKDAGTSACREDSSAPTTFD